MTPEQKLATLLAVEAPPRRDYAFEVEVARRIARRRAWLTVAALLPWVVVSGIVLWALQPVLIRLASDLVPVIQPVALIGAATLVASGVGLWLTGALQRRVTVVARPK